MKKFRFLTFSIITFLLATLTFIPNKNNKEQYVRIENGVFKIDNDTFFPLMLNYVVEFRNPNGQFTLSPAQVYEDPQRYETNSKEAILNQLQGHFQLIREMGFNTLRICFDRICQDNHGHYYYIADGQKYYIAKDYPAIITGVKEMLTIAQKEDLLVMLLIKAPFDKELKKFTTLLLKALRNDPTLFAYDFFNEPLYFDNDPKRTKQEAYNIVNSWNNMLEKHAPHQLFTIGFSEPLEVFEWDPSILPVDFLAFHTYHPLRVPNEIYWFSTYTGKPWILGETGLPADNDSISYDEQRQFMREVYRYVRDCGGIGMGWWEFQEVPDSHFEAQYTALLNHEGITRTRGGHEIIGTVKPAVAEIADFAKYKPQKKWRAANYYNMMGYQNYLIRGKITDSKGQPIDGAVIRGWNKDWSIGQNTFSDSLGNYTLYSNDPCVHFEISACGMTKIKFSDHNICYRPANGYKTGDPLPDRDLEYHHISFQPFLKDTTAKNMNYYYHIFNFNDTLLHRYRLVGEIKTCKLSKLQIRK